MDEPLMRLTGAAGTPQANVAYFVQDGVGSIVAMAQTLAVANQARESGATVSATGNYSAASYPVADLANGVTIVSSSEGWVGNVAQSAAVTVTLAAAQPVERVELMAVANYRPSAYVIETRNGSGAWVQAASGNGDDFAAWSDGSSVRAVKSFNPVVASEVRVRFTGATDASGLVWLTELQAWNAAGQTTAAQRFDAWGRAEQAAGSVPTYGYTGREPDATGLMYYRARYYHPEIGRFVSRDLLGLAAGINPYAYADGNPVLYNDPDGLLATLAWNSVKSTSHQAGLYFEGKLNEAMQYISQNPFVTKANEGQNIGGGAEITGMIGPVGVSQSVVQVVDTKFQSCSVSSSCAVLGLGAFLGTQGVVSASMGLLSPGDTVGIGIFATAGIAGSGSVSPLQINLDGSASGQIGVGSGTGVGFGVKLCRATTFACGPIGE